MTTEIDLFGHPSGPAQGSLFGEGRMEPPAVSYLPDPEDIRRKLNKALAQARAADTMPWPEREARVWRIVFPNMANWLPEEEANQLRLAFAGEMERLGRAT